MSNSEQTESARSQIALQRTERDTTGRGAQLRAKIFIGLALLGIGALGLLGAFALGIFAQSGSEQGSISYTTESQNSTGVANSPLVTMVRLPWREGSPESTVAAVTLLILDEAGQPASFGAEASQGLAMKPGLETGEWMYPGSVPSVPGDYTARIVVERLYGTTPPETIEFSDAKLTATEEQGNPLTSGYVLTRDNDLWLLATDMSRERRLTFYGGTGAVALNPRWSPDGKHVAFTFLPVRPVQQLPRTEIWIIKPDGSGAQMISEPGPHETLARPAWTDGGKAMYFSVDRLSNDSLAPGTPLSFMNSFRRIDRVDLLTGERTELLTGAQWPATGQGDSNRMVLAYIEDALPAEPGGAPQERLVIQRGVDEEPLVLVEGGVFQKFNAPSISPDGKWVAFSAFVEALPDKDGFNLLDWLLFKPEVAYAHEAPWDIYLAPTQTGAAPTQITEFGEDEPVSVWLDSSTLAIMGEKSLYRLEIDGRGEAVGAPLPLRPGLKHGEITWFGP